MPGRVSVVAGGREFDRRGTVEQAARAAVITTIGAPVICRDIASRHPTVAHEKAGFSSNFVPTTCGHRDR